MPGEGNVNLYRPSLADPSNIEEMRFWLTNELGKISKALIQGDVRLLELLDAIETDLNVTTYISDATGDAEATVHEGWNAFANNLAITRDVEEVIFFNWPGGSPDVYRYVGNEFGPVWASTADDWVLSGGSTIIEWGSIIGTLSDQLDLQAELDGKADSGAEDTALWGDIAGNINAQTDLIAELFAKLSRDGSSGMTGNLPMGQNRIVNLGIGVDGVDATTFEQQRNIFLQKATLDTKNIVCAGGKWTNAGGLVGSFGLVTFTQTATGSFEILVNQAPAQASDITFGGATVNIGLGAGVITYGPPLVNFSSYIRLFMAAPGTPNIGFDPAEFTFFLGMNV